MQTTLELVDKLLERETNLPENILYNDFNNSKKVKFIFLRCSNDSSWFCDTTKIWGADVEAEYIVDVLTDDSKLDNFEFLSVNKDIDFSKINNVDILAYSTNKYNSKYISSFISHWKPKVLLHLSDDNFKNCRKPDLINFSKVNLVYMQYGYKKIENINNDVYNKIKILPIGYHCWGKKYIRSNQVPIKDRKYIWCFSGSMKGKRKSELEELNKFIPNFNKPTKAYEATEMFSNSKFAYCPKGNTNIECSRIYEAMYNGCIPILLEEEKNTNNFKELFEIPIPVYFASSVNEMIDIINNTTDEELEQMQQKMIKWLNDISLLIRTNIMNAIKN